MRRYRVWPTSIGQIICLVIGLFHSHLQTFYERINIGDVMKVLLILAHGSRKKESNEEVQRIAEDLDKTGNSGFDKVLCAFNQFSKPSAEDQIEILVGMGATHITVLPYFIAAGSHVMSDIPELVKAAEQKYSGVTFKMTPHFGAFEGVKTLILKELSGKD
jgi:sirohydrochlorin cobaltochelatase